MKLIDTHPTFLTTDKLQFTNEICLFATSIFIATAMAAPVAVADPHWEVLAAGGTASLVVIKTAVTPTTITATGTTITTPTRSLTRFILFLVVL